MHNSILAYICTPGEIVVLLNPSEADFQDGSPGLVLGIRRGQVEVKLLHTGRSVLLYPENFVDANEESSDCSVDGDFEEDDDDDHEGMISMEEVESLRRKISRSKNSSFASEQPAKRARVFVPSPEMIIAHSKSVSHAVHNLDGTVSDHPLYSSSAGNVFLPTNPRRPSLREPELTTEGDEEASHWLRSIRVEIEHGNDRGAEILLRDILTHHQYCTAAWVELATVLVRKGDHRGAVHALHKACHTCPLKSDFQTMADTIEMYLVAAKLLSSIENGVALVDVIPHSSAAPPAPPLEAIPLLRDVSKERDSVSLVTPLPSSQPSCNDLQASGESNNNLPVTAPSDTVVGGELRMHSQVERELSVEEDIKRHWLQLRALLRGLNVARAAGMVLQFPSVPSSGGRPTPASSSSPAISFKKEHEYLRPFVAEVLYEMGQCLHRLSELYHHTSRPNNCLAGAYCLLKLAMQQMPFVHGATYSPALMDLFDVCESKLRDEGALVDSPMK